MHLKAKKPLNRKFKKFQERIYVAAVVRTVMVESDAGPMRSIRLKQEK